MTVKGKRMAASTLAAVAAFVAGSVYAFTQRGYLAVGGEFILLLIPALVEFIAYAVREGERDRGDGRRA